MASDQVTLMEDPFSLNTLSSLVTRHHSRSLVGSARLALNSNGSPGVVSRLTRLFETLLVTFHHIQEIKFMIKTLFTYRL